MKLISIMMPIIALGARDNTESEESGTFASRFFHADEVQLEFLPHREVLAHWRSNGWTIPESFYSSTYGIKCTYAIGYICGNPSDSELAEHSEAAEARERGSCYGPRCSELLVNSLSGRYRDPRGEGGELPRAQVIDGMLCHVKGGIGKVCVTPNPEVPPLRVEYTQICCQGSVGASPNDTVRFAAHVPTTSAGITCSVELHIPRCFLFEKSTMRPGRIETLDCDAAMIVSEWVGGDIPINFSVMNTRVRLSIYHPLPEGMTYKYDSDDKICGLEPMDWPNNFWNDFQSQEASPPASRTPTPESSVDAHDVFVLQEIESMHSEQGDTSNSETNAPSWRPAVPNMRPCVLSDLESDSGNDSNPPSYEPENQPLRIPSPGSMPECDPLPRRFIPTPIPHRHVPSQPESTVDPNPRSYEPEIQPLTIPSSNGSMPECDPVPRRFIPTPIPRLNPVEIQQLSIPSSAESIPECEPVPRRFIPTPIARPQRIVPSQQESGAQSDPEAESMHQTPDTASQNRAQRISQVIEELNRFVDAQRASRLEKKR